MDFVVGMHHEDEHAPRLAELERIRSDRYFELIEGFNQTCSKVKKIQVKVQVKSNK